jgi:pimeloyl-ACP methyl ester carboxylesterase
MVTAIDPRSELPAAVAAVIAAPAERVDVGRRATTHAAGIPFSSIEWGDPGDRPLILIHGVTASARIWWRIGPALAESGRHVVAVDLPGHGLTGHWVGHHRFRDNAADVAVWIRAVELDVPSVQIVGHSWGAMTAAALPAVGIRPACLVLLEPPAVPHSVIARMAADPAEQGYPSFESAVNALTAAAPTWAAEDVRAKAEALTQLDRTAARSILLDNGDWDGGLADLLDPAADGIPIWIIRAEATPTGLTPSGGLAGLMPEAALPPFETRVGTDHILTIPGAEHAPQRTHPAALTAAILRGLG